jgi:hypothetical protein
MTRLPAIAVLRRNTKREAPACGSLFHLGNARFRKDTVIARSPLRVSPLRRLCRLRFFAHFFTMLVKKVSNCVFFKQQETIFLSKENFLKLTVDAVDKRGVLPLDELGGKACGGSCDSLAGLGHAWGCVWRKIEALFAFQSALILAFGHAEAHGTPGPAAVASARGRDLVRLCGPERLRFRWCAGWGQSCLTAWGSPGSSSHIPISAWRIFPRRGRSSLPRIVDMAPLAVGP